MQPDSVLREYDKYWVWNRNQCANVNKASFKVDFNIFILKLQQSHFFFIIQTIKLSQYETPNEILVDSLFFSFPSSSIYWSEH